MDDGWPAQRGPSCFIQTCGIELLKIAALAYPIHAIRTLAATLWEGM